MSYAQQAISNLDQTINSFKSRVDVKVSDVSSSTASIQATTNRIYENIERFKNDLMHGEESQIAHENILRIDQIIKEQFSNHIAIRRTVMGVVRDFDINLVRNSTIQELSEELWITSSRYWLSYALIAITAWVNNYPDVAKNALAESGRKDSIKTTLFFCLMNLRFGRMEAAKKWFHEYFKTLDPTMLQQETAILLQSFLNGIFGKDKELEQEVIELIDEWITIINDNEQIVRQTDLGMRFAFLIGLPWVFRRDRAHGTFFRAEAAADAGLASLRLEGNAAEGFISAVASFQLQLSENAAFQLLPDFSGKGRQLLFILRIGSSRRIAAEEGMLCHRGHRRRADKAGAFQSILQLRQGILPGPVAVNADQHSIGTVAGDGL